MHGAENLTASTLSLATKPPAHKGVHAGTQIPIAIHRFIHTFAILIAWVTAFTAKAAAPLLLAEKVCTSTLIVAQATAGAQAKAGITCQAC